MRASKRHNRIPPFRDKKTWELCPFIENIFSVISTAARSPRNAGSTLTPRHTHTTRNIQELFAGPRTTPFREAPAHRRRRPGATGGGTSHHFPSTGGYQRGSTFQQHDFTGSRHPSTIREVGSPATFRVSRQLRQPGGHHFRPRRATSRTALTKRTRLCWGHSLEQCTCARSFSLCSLGCLLGFFRFECGLSWIILFGLFIGFFSL